MPSTRSLPKVIDPDGSPVDDAPDLDEEDETLPAAVPLEEAEIPEALVFHSDAEAQEARAVDPGTPFEFDGKRYRAYRPKDAVMVTLLAASSNNATMADQVQAVMLWLSHCLEPVATMALQNRIYDRTDHLEWDDLAGIMVQLLKHWEAADANRATRRAGEKTERRLPAGSPAARKTAPKKAAPAKAPARRR